MGLYFTNEFILSKKNQGAMLIVPVPRQISPLAVSLIRITKAIPAIGKRLEDFWDAQTLEMGMVTDMEGASGAAYGFVVMQERARDVVSVNNVVDTLIALSKNLPKTTGRYVIAPLATKEQIPTEVMKKLISGIFQDCFHHITFTVDE